MHSETSKTWRTFASQLRSGVCNQRTMINWQFFCSCFCVFVTRKLRKSLNRKVCEQGIRNSWGLFNISWCARLPPQDLESSPPGPRKWTSVWTNRPTSLAYRLISENRIRVHAMHYNVHHFNNKDIGGVYTIRPVLSCAPWMSEGETCPTQCVDDG